MNQAKRRQPIDPMKARVDILKCVLIDSMFLACWTGITWGLNHILSLVEISGYVDNVAFNTFQWIFGASTLVPIIIYTILDIAKVFIRAYTEIEHTWETRNVYPRS